MYVGDQTREAHSLKTLALESGREDIYIPHQATDFSVQYGKRNIM
jgi:hypothetical protein